MLMDCLTVLQICDGCESVLQADYSWFWWEQVVFNEQNTRPWPWGLFDSIGKQLLMSSPSIWSMCFNCTCFGRDLRWRATLRRDAHFFECGVPFGSFCCTLTWVVFPLTGRWSPHLTTFWWHECRHKVMCVLAFWMQVEQVWRSQISLEVRSATANVCIVGWWLYNICTVNLFVRYYDAKIFRDMLSSGEFGLVLQFKQILGIKLRN